MQIKEPLPEVETKRLRLRRFRPTDVDALAVVFAKPEVWRFPYGRGFSHHETAKFISAQIDEWDAVGFGCWLAEERNGGRVVGYVGLSVPHFLPEILPAVEVGWRFDPDIWGRGYATEGASAALDQAFDALGLNRVCSAPQSENPRSGDVCKRLGMSLERVATAPPTDRRGAVEVDLYWMSADAWRERRKP